MCRGSGEYVSPLPSLVASESDTRLFHDLLSSLSHFDLHLLYQGSDHREKTSLALRLIV